MKLADSSLQVTLDIYQNALVATLKAFADRPLARIDLVRLSEQGILHDLGQQHLCHLHGQVEMIAHGTKP